MASSPVVPLFTIEARIKRALRRHLRQLGFGRSRSGELALPGDSKDSLRAMHHAQRQQRLRCERRFVRREWSLLCEHFAAGRDVDPRIVRPRLELVRAKTWQSRLFRLASLTWSVPVSQGYGRRMRFLVWDASNAKLIGLIGLADPVFNLRARDEFVGWTAEDRRARLVNVLDAYVIGAIPPYSMLLGGKLVASLVCTAEINAAFAHKYSRTRGIISRERKGAVLAMVTTSSALGRSSMYNRLRLPGCRLFRSVGYTSGWGHFHIPDQLFSTMREYLRFAHNQENFTGGQPIIPVVAVIEEAQSVLGRRLDEASPFVEWVKEGRKYELGAVLITQQPGSMAPELLSQADNWFCFHLLSEGDAGTLGKYNAHFSDDVLAHMIGEPIPGNCFVWSAPHQPFVLPVRIRSFESLYREEVRSSSSEGGLDGLAAQAIAETLAGALKRLSAALLAKLREGSGIKFWRIPDVLPGDGESLGIYSGQLYHLIRDLGPEFVSHPVNHLKKILLDDLLGEAVVHQVQHKNREYYCAALAEWERVLGRSPEGRMPE